MIEEKDLRLNAKFRINEIYEDQFNCSFTAIYKIKTEDVKNSEDENDANYFIFNNKIFSESSHIWNMQIDGKNVEPISNFLSYKKINSKFKLSGYHKVYHKLKKTYDAYKFMVFRSLFQGCISLIKVDFSRVIGEELTDLSNTFNGCSSLISVDLSRINTENLENISGIFKGCSSLKYVKFRSCLKCSNFSADKISKMDQAFEGCNSLKRIDLSKLSFEKPPSVDKMLNNCKLNYNLICYEAGHKYKLKLES